MQTIINGLSVNTYGDKNNQPIIFVHGFPFDHTMWEEQIKAFKENYYCVAYDIRGLGKSIIGDGQYTMEMYVEDLFELISELKLENPVLCGLSMGGYISLRALEINQYLFKSVILCDTRSEADTDEGKLKRAKAIKQINSEGPEKFVEGFISGLFADITKEERPSLYKSFVSRYKSHNPVGIKGASIAILSRTDTTKFLSEIKIPALLLCGSFDTLTPPLVMRGMADKIKNSEFAVIPMTGHLAPLENPACTNDLIWEFLNKNQ